MIKKQYGEQNSIPCMFKVYSITYNEKHLFAIELEPAFHLSSVDITFNKHTVL